MSQYIPTTSKWVNVDGLHPVMKHRLELFFSDERIHGRLEVVSGVRTRAHQAKLYKRYKEGKGVLAANPERTLPGGWVGSWHMTQLDGYGHAVDFRIINRSLSTAVAAAIANDYGLQQTVVGEWWHFQWRNADGIFPGPKTVAKDDALIDWAAITAYLDAVGHNIALVAIRKGSQGVDVEATQKLLANAGHDPGAADGIYGRRTKRAVKSFQRDNPPLAIDGIVGAHTYTPLRHAQP